MINRTWQDVMDAVIRTKHRKTKERYDRASKEKAFDAIGNIALIETTADNLLGVMAKGTVCTNVQQT